MTFREFWAAKDQRQRQRFAERAGTTVKYIEVHLMRTPPTRTPRKPLLEGLVAASNGQLSMNDMLEHFYADAAA